MIKNAGNGDGKHSRKGRTGNIGKTKAAAMAMMAAVTYTRSCRRRRTPEGTDNAFLFPVMNRLSVCMA
jgi:hypothetical protein